MSEAVTYNTQMYVENGSFLHVVKIKVKLVAAESQKLLL